MSIYEYTVNKANHESYSLSEYKDQVVLIVNTASECGFTKQFDGLEKLYQEYKEQGFTVLGFPCNQFGGQEPGTGAEAEQNCRLNYGVTFLIHEKIEVNGDNAHPLFKYLKEETKGLMGSKIKWNFTKFLVDRQGDVVERFAPTTTPEQLKKHIEKYL
ncbi:glutathione peroxidase [Macrococcoides canis]|uniref:Glutathione peroxidase n=1 Tax=Macrococcoides canis TaxID=1855823 RepID=A0A6G7ER15_9STAP|nr:glutathione peroxidase [Macrococcus canis]MCO4096284.1 glutathione peroxidase [Macrococcus canis]QCT74733.1 glutathione peroxidase [Macrococcus canis]QIH75802.1 redoxin domain-containing protein [Macrococcus canis]QIH78250.1 redoxin domain-containing protein [Macrococcus canis]QNR07752.1 redoxin domain-containing protein [Macrococcus canis]